MNKAQYIPYLWWWLIIAALPVARMLVFPSRSVGLVIGYCFQLWMFYWLGAALHALPWSDLPDDGFVLIGFKESVIGFAGFVLGSTIMAPVLFKTRAPRITVTQSRLPLEYVFAGAMVGFVLRPILNHIPSAGALTSAGQQFALAGICLGCWQAWMSGHKRQMLKWIAVVPFIPLASLIGQGFLSFGVLAVAAVLCFLSQFIRPRWALLLVLGISSYVGLSVYAAYMRDRVLIRDAVWTNQSLAVRMERVTNTLQSVEPFSLRNAWHLELVDGRLNQNGLVGAAVVNLSANQDYVKGETLWMAVLAMIPRALWPDKPISAGSGDWVTRFTGIVFAEGTSVGIGPVMELYANFGAAGEFWGFVILGLIVGLVDIKASIYLYTGEWHRFSVWFAAGLGLLNVSGSLVEVTATAVGCIALGFLLKIALRSRSADLLRPGIWPAPADHRV
jgi:hypothetical protein